MTFVIILCKRSLLEASFAYNNGYKNALSNLPGKIIVKFVAEKNVYTGCPKNNYLF